jgi:hypothetical protein
MKLYKSTEGYEYTEDEILAAAKESNMSLDDYIAEFKMTPIGQGEPGKKKPVAKKGAVATGKTKGTASKPATISSASRKKLFKEEVQPQTQTDGTFVAKPKILKPKVAKEPTIKEKVEEGKQILQEAKEINKPKRELKAKISLPSEEDILDISTNVQGVEYDKLEPEEKLYVDNKSADILQKAYGEGAEYDLSPSEIELKSREILSKAKQTKKTIVEESYGSKLLNVDLLKGLNYLGEAFASVPETIYNVFSLPQNAYAAISGNKDWAESAKQFKKERGIENPIMDNFIAEQERLGKTQTIYNNANYDSTSITENIGDGNYVDAFKLMGSGLAESAPMSIAMMAGGAELKLAELAAGSTALLAGPNIRQQEEENPEQSELASVIKGFGMAGAESVFSAIGEGSLGKVYKDIIKKEGAEVGSKIFKDGLVTMYQSALKKFGAPAAMLGEGIEEVATTITQNMINNKNPFEGALDSFALGVGGGGLYGSPLTIAKGISGFKDGVTVHKINKQLKTENINNLVTAFKPEFQSSPAKIKAAIIPGSIKILDNQVDTSVNNGDMTVEEGDKIKLNFRQTQGIVNALQPLKLSDEDLPAAVDLIKEKKQLEEVVKKVGDPNLTVEQGNRIKEINTALTGIGESNTKKKSAENVAKLEGNIAALEGFANTLGQTEFENAVGEGKGVESFETVADFKAALENTGNYSESEINEAMESDGFMLKNGQIVINKQIAAQRNLHTMGHELLHKILKSEFSDPVRGKELKDKFLAQLSPEERKLLDERILAVDENTVVEELRKELGREPNETEIKQAISEGKGRLYSDEYLEEAPDEYLTQYFQIVADKKIPWSEKLGDSLEKLWKNFLGLFFTQKGYDKLEFADGKDIYRFINDYAKSIKSGKISQRAQDLTKAGTNIKKAVDAPSKSNLQGLLTDKYGNNKRRFISEGLMTTPKGKETFDFTKSVIGEELGGLVETITRRLYDGIPADSKKTVSREDYKTALISAAATLIDREWDPSKQDLDKFVSNRLNLRANSLAKELGIEGITEGGIKADVDQAKSLMTEETKQEVKEKPKYKTILESKVFKEEVVNSVKDKLVRELRTLKSKIDEAVSINKTTTPLIAEIKDAMGKQADIDIKKALGGKPNNEFRSNILKNKKAILENMTTTWLMGKATKKGVEGGIPAAIQKQVDGKFLSYPDWVGKKIDREKVTTNLAGKTSGADIVRRLPNAVNNVSDADFLSSFLEPNGDLIRGRKESLSKAMAEELSFDIFKQGLEEGGPIAEAFERNQELKDVVLLDNYVNEVARQLDRGTAKFSKTLSVGDRKIIVPDEYLTTEGATSRFINNVGELIKDIADTDIDEVFDFETNELLQPFSEKYDEFVGEFVAALYETGRIESKAGVQFKQAIYKNENIPAEVRATFKKVGNLRYNKEALDDLNQATKEIAKRLDPSVLKAIGYDWLGYTHRVMNSAKERKDGTPGEFYEELNSLKEIIGEGALPNGLNIADIRLMNKAFPLFKKVQKILNQETTRENKLEQLKELQPEIEAANAANIQLAVHLGAVIGNLLKEGKISSIAALNLAQIQTGIVAGWRGLSRLDLITVTDKSQKAIKGDDSTKSKGEHLAPNSNTMLKMVDVWFNAAKDNSVNIEKELNEVFSEHSQWLTNVAITKVIDKKGGTNNPTNFHRVKFASKEDQADVYGVDGQSYMQVLAKMEAMMAVNKAFNEFKVAIEPEIQKDKTFDKAMANASKFSKTPKKIRVFDFDDTLAQTKSNVLYTMPGDPKQYKIDAATFAKEGKFLEDAGAKWDFSEFSKVMNGKKGPLFEVAKIIADKKGTNDVFVLTARPANSAGPIQEFLKSLGLDIPVKNITGLGNSLPQAKADWIVEKAAEGYNDFYFADDHTGNVKAVKDALSVLDVKNRVQQAKVKFSLSSRRDLQWTTKDKSVFNADFKVGEQDYEIGMEPTGVMGFDNTVMSRLYYLTRRNGLNHSVIFGEENKKSQFVAFQDKKRGMDITGTGNAAEVFGIVLNGLVDVTMEKDIKSFAFVAMEPSRIKLYNTLSTVLAERLGWNSYSIDGAYIVADPSLVTTAPKIETVEKPKRSNPDIEWDFDEGVSSTDIEIEGRKYRVDLEDTSDYYRDAPEDIENRAEELAKKYSIDKKNILGTSTENYTAEISIIQPTVGRFKGENTEKTAEHLADSLVDFVEQQGSKNLVSYRGNAEESQLFQKAFDIASKKLGWQVFSDYGINLLSAPQVSTGNAKFSKSISNIQSEPKIGLLNKAQANKLQKEIEANYNSKLKLGNKNNDVRTSMFNYDNPIAQKMSNGIDLRITEGLIRDGKKMYLLYADGKIIGEFNAVNDAKGLIKYIEDNLIVPDKIQGETKFSKSIDQQFNEIIETNKGIGAQKRYSGITSKRLGASKGNYKFFLPPGAEDFEGLLYNFLGKGKEGEAQAEFFERTLLAPYWEGVSAIESARQKIKRDFKALKKAFPDAADKITKKTPDGNFTYDQAIRVYLWTKEGKAIPELSRGDQARLNSLVANDPQLAAFANGLELVSGRTGGWSDPSEFWDSDTIVSELNDMTEKVGRKTYLEEFIKNADEIFSNDNMNKIEAIYGTNIREALEGALYRMKNGKNQSMGTGKATAAVNAWVNGSVAEIMFLNTKSGVLQLISALNYLNLRDNNPIMAGKALLDFPQFAKDFATIFNSDMMKERRQGLKEDVSAAEIANAAATSKNKVKAVTAYLAKIGFTPTTIADALAIGMGGASFYRNRINTYKKQGMSEAEAEAQAWKDFTRLTNKSAQSNDPALISQQQAEPIGRIILAFGNATMQMNRIMKKSARDLINGRGNPAEHVAKILFYGFIQNAIFSALQKAVFIGLFGDDDEEEEKDKKKQKTTEEKAIELADDMLDSFLRGSGLAGAVVSTAKNTAQEYVKQRAKKQKGDQAYTLLAGLNISPPIGSKVRKIYGAIQEEKFNRAVIERMGGKVMLDGRLNPSPIYNVGAKLVAAGTNLPADRLLNKITNISEALDARNENWQRAMLMLGYKPFELGVENEEQEAIKAQAKLEREDEVFIEGIEKKKAKIHNVSYYVRNARFCP